MTIHLPLFHHDHGTGKGPDVIIFEVLEDCSIKITTDPISGANHAAAEGMLSAIAEMAGGLTRRIRRRITRLTHKIAAHITTAR